MKKTKLLCLALCITSLCACGENSNTQGNNPISGSGGKVETITDPWWETTGELTKENDQIVFEDVDLSLTTVVAGEDQTAFEELVAQFNSEYKNKISVSVISLNQSIFEGTVSQQISNNSGAPDIIMSHQKAHKTMADNKLIQPFDEAMEKANIQLNMQDYAQGLAKYTDLGFQGYTFGVPIDAQSEVVYYNKQMLNKYGGQLPTNRAELIDLCKKVATGEKITPIAWSTSLDFFQNYVFPTSILQNGGKFYNNEYRVEWESDPTNLEAFKNGIQSIREFTTMSPVIAKYDVSSSAALESFLSNKALFFVGLPWNSRSIIETYGSRNGGLNYETTMKDRVGGTSIANWFEMGTPSDNGNKIFGDSHFFAMSKTVKNIEKKAAACEFIRWFTQNAEVGTKWAQAGHITASTIISNDETYSSDNYVTNYTNMFYPDLNYFECAGVTPHYTTVFSELIVLFNETKMNKNSSEDEKNIKAAAEKINQTIDFLNMDI